MRWTHIHALGALVFIVSVALLIPAGRAFAHAGYDHSTPAKDEVVPTAPVQVDAYFKQKTFRQTGAFYLRVYADDNTTQVSQGDGTLDDIDRHHMSAALPAGLPKGRYIVHWATQSDEDGESDSGMYCFYIGVQPTAAQQAECASFAPTTVPTIGGTSQATSAATSSPSTTAATPVSTPAGKSDSGGGGNTGVIVGVGIGAIVAVIVVGGAGLWWRSRQA